MQETKDEPSEEPFDISAVPREVKTQPLAEKKATGKKPAGLGEPPSGPPSTVDAYEQLLSSISEFSSFGKLFKSSAPVELTEAETEYEVNVVKHIHDGHVVFQYNCTNTIPTQLLENVTVFVYSSEAEEFTEVVSNPVALEVFHLESLVENFRNALESMGDDGVEDDYQLEDLEVVHRKRRCITR
ncbi:Coatomer subunit gamma [Acorus gramineus]|uniref:Coatomer subunit gamma n=1 Tax=Acorus gramineus TaxID=55184 RepID=A0AAV9BJ81_ACOGR|nr:Coatomer subunit gamma [Acorus gramineus]